MSKQLPLFEPQFQTWVHRIWLRMAPDRHRQILSMIAEMARASLPQKAPMRKEGTDESR